MSCQICVEVCPFDAIKMDTEYELSTDDRFGGLLSHKQNLSKPNSHYHRIHRPRRRKSTPGLTAEKVRMEAKARADAEAKAKAKAAPAPAAPAR